MIFQAVCSLCLYNISSWPHTCTYDDSDDDDDDDDGNVI